MALPNRASIEDVNQTCSYLANKPTGATLKEIAGVVGETLVHSNRIAALQAWGLIAGPDDGRYKVTADGRRCSKGDPEKAAVLKDVIRRIPPYMAIVERAAHRREDSLTTNDVGAHWHEHFRGDASSSDVILKQQAISFFQIAQGAGLGTMIIGRRGAETRFSFTADALNSFISGSTIPLPAEPLQPMEVKGDVVEGEPIKPEPVGTAVHPEVPKQAGQGIFIGHGKNKKPLEQLKKVLDQFRIPYKVATEEPNLGRPISAKVREIMQSCNCAILIFTADEEFKTPAGVTIWRPSENVVHELGASGYLYDNRLVIMKEEGVTFPSNFHDIGYISFEKDQLEAKSMDVLKELIGFGIVKIST